MKSKDIRVIIPALNEQNAIGYVIKEIPKDWVSEIIVVDNGSSDQTFATAQKLGVVVLKEPKRGYGWACLKAIDHLSKSNLKPDIVVFIDADYSDYPTELVKLVDPIINGAADMVIGSRYLGIKEPGSMMPQQIFGNWLATKLISYLYGTDYTDLGPFRAIKYEALMQLKMDDKTLESMKIVIEIRERLKANDFETLEDGLRMIIDETILIRGILKDILDELELRNKRFFL